MYDSNKFFFDNSINSLLQLCFATRSTLSIFPKKKKKKTLHDNVFTLSFFFTHFFPLRASYN